MNKQEFLASLSRALTGKVDAGKAAETVNYYSDYIDKQIRMGRSEAEVLEELGDPRLLVRTMVTAQGSEDEFQGRGNSGAGYTYAEDDSDRNAEHTSRGVNVNFNGRNHYTPLWLALVVLLLIVVLIFAIVGSILSLLAPILVPLLLVMGIVWLIRNYR